MSERLKSCQSYIDLKFYTSAPSRLSIVLMTLTKVSWVATVYHTSPRSGLPVPQETDPFFPGARSGEVEVLKALCELSRASEVCNVCDCI